MSAPVAKTFYTHRIFLVYRPDDYRAYLNRMIDKEHWPALEQERFPLELGLLAWGTILIYRARMVPFDFNRELKRLVDDKGQFLDDDPSVPLSRTIFRQQLLLQLAIEAITRRSDVKERIADVPLFWQYIYDTLYWPSYHHERGICEVDKHGKEKPFVLTREKLREHLWFRAQGEPGQPDKSFAPRDIIEVLFRALEEYLLLLANPESVRNETINYAYQRKEDQRLWVALGEALDTQPLVNLGDPQPPVVLADPQPPIMLKRQRPRARARAQ